MREKLGIPHYFSYFLLPNRPFVLFKYSRDLTPNSPPRHYEGLLQYGASKELLLSDQEFHKLQEGAIMVWTLTTALLEDTQVDNLIKQM